MITRALLYGLIIAGALATAAGMGYHRGVQRLWDYQVEQARATTKLIVKQGEVTERVVTEYVERAGKTRTITQTIEKEVIRYEKADLDQCPLSTAAVSLHDSAATNTVPIAPGPADGTPSGITTAAAVKTVTQNYAVCHETRERLMALQDWVRRQQAANPVITQTRQPDRTALPPAGAVTTVANHQEPDAPQPRLATPGALPTM